MGASCHKLLSNLVQVLWEGGTQVALRAVNHKFRLGLCFDPELHDVHTESSDSSFETGHKPYSSPWSGFSHTGRSSLGPQDRGRSPPTGKT